MALKIKSDLPLLKQYDKILAVTVLIGLLVSLFYLTSAGAARKKNEADFIQGLDNLKPRSALAQPMDMGGYEEVARNLRRPLQLAALDSQRAGLLTPERRVICVNAECQKPVPFEAEKCPFCGATQPPVNPVIEGLDTDKDGIPDKIEIEWGLNPLDPSDAAGDLDGDGFTNLEEYLAGTDPRDPKKHPALVTLLRVRDLQGKRLPLVFSGVNQMPDGVQLVFNYVGPIPRTFWVRENQPIGETDYVAGKVNLKVEERENPNMPGNLLKVDVSTVVVKRKSDNQELT